MLLRNLKICICCRSGASVFLYNRSVSLSFTGDCRAPCAVFSKHKECQEAQASHRTCRAWCVRGSSSVGLAATHAWALGLYLCCSVSTFLAFSLRKLVAREFSLWAHRAVLWEVWLCVLFQLLNRLSSNWGLLCNAICVTANTFNHSPCRIPEHFPK